MFAALHRYRDEDNIFQARAALRPECFTVGRRRRSLPFKINEVMNALPLKSAPVQQTSEKVPHPHSFSCTHMHTHTHQSSLAPAPPHFPSPPLPLSLPLLSSSTSLTPMSVFPVFSFPHTVLPLLPLVFPHPPPPPIAATFRRKRLFFSAHVTLGVELLSRSPSPAPDLTCDQTTLHTKASRVCNFLALFKSLAPRSTLRDLLQSFRFSTLQVSRCPSPSRPLRVRSHLRGSVTTLVVTRSFHLLSVKSLSAVDEVPLASPYCYFSWLLLYYHS